MKPSATASPRRKSRELSTKHDPAVAETVGTGLSNGNSAEDAYPHIAALAYQLYEQRGCQDGHDVEDWLKAEQIILAGSS